MLTVSTKLRLSENISHKISQHNLICRMVGNNTIFETKEENGYASRTVSLEKLQGTVGRKKVPRKVLGNMASENG